MIFREGTILMHKAAASVIFGSTCGVGKETGALCLNKRWLSCIISVFRRQTCVRLALDI